MQTIDDLARVSIHVSQFSGYVNFRPLTFSESEDSLLDSFKHEASVELEL